MEYSGEDLRLAIKGKGLNVEDAGKALGLSRTTMYTLFKMDILDDTTVQNVKVSLGIWKETSSNDSNGEELPQIKQSFLNEATDRLKRILGMGKLTSKNTEAMDKLTRLFEELEEGDKIRDEIKQELQTLQQNTKSNNKKD